MNEEELTPSQEEENDVLQEAEEETGTLSEEVSDEEVSDEEETAEKSVVKDPVGSDGYKKQRRQKRYRAPLIIAACAFAVTILFFCGWQCFFNTDIKGCWKLEISIPDSDKKAEYNFTFEDNNVMRYQTGGQAAIGRYFLSKKNGKDLLTFFLTNGQNYPLSAEFNYSFSGNIFTGRHLSLTDLSGFLLVPDDKDADSENVAAKQKITGSVKENDTTYYVWDLTTPSHEEFKQDKPAENFREDKQLTGTWIYKAEEDGFDYTFTFNSDGTFEQRNFESEIHGTYSVSDGKCKVSFYSLSNELMDGELAYSVKDNVLTFGTHQFTRTDDKNAYKIKSSVK